MVKMSDKGNNYLDFLNNNLRQLNPNYFCGTNKKEMMSFRELHFLHN